MTEEFSVQVPAPAGEEARTVTVFLPETDAQCPVLYLFDGQTAFFDERAPFGTSLRIGEYLRQNAIDLIAVGVDCDRVNRLTEYSPFPFRAGKCVSEGKGRVYMDWLVSALKPAIDARYPTLSDRAHTFLMGSSMGGLMALYALADYGAVFGGAIAMSPSFWTDEQKCVEMAERVPHDAKLYVDYGTAELRSGRGSHGRALSAVVQALRPFDGFRFVLEEGGKHNEEAWRRRLPSALRHLLGANEGGASRKG